MNSSFSIWDQLTENRLKQSLIHLKSCPSIKIRQTPLLCIDPSQSTLVQSLGVRKLYLKLENLQLCGSFKIRGIVNFLAGHDLTAGTRFVTMTAGNFGRSFSYACGLLGIPLLVLMPVDVPPDRVQAVQKNGARVELLPRTELQARVDELVAREGMVYAHPFDDLDLISGYASIVQELHDAVAVLEKGTPLAEEASPEEEMLDLLLTGVGGGGLISGLLAGQRQLGLLTCAKKRCQIIGVEPEGACAMHQSLQAGHPVTLQRISSFINGLSAPFAGENCFQVIQSTGTNIVLVSDQSVKEAMAILTNEFKLLVESSGAAPLAALMALPQDQRENKNVCLILSGGNIAIDELYQILYS